MLRFSAPALLSMSLALPGASLALGLGDIHVESTLHQPLAAQIELVGAVHEDLASLSVGIPDQEVFQRYGLQRPSFLSTTALKVSQDRQGRPVLELRSTEAFTEPLVTFLVDLHTPNGELVREYTVLLDPPGLAPEHDGLESTSATPAPSAAIAQTSALVATPTRAVTARDIKPPSPTYTVAPRDTLDRIVTIAHARSRSDRHRMMIAIFRANPNAFQTNLNMLRTGATVHYPSAAELSAISADEADHEFAAQMAAWRASAHRLPATVAVTAKPVADAKPDTESGKDPLELTQRVESLEKSFDELRQDLKQSPVERASVPAAAAPAPARAPAMTAEPPQRAEEPAPALPRGMLLAALAGGGLAALAAGVWFHRRHRSGENRPTEPREAQDSPLRQDTEHNRSVEARTSPPFRQTAVSASYLVEEVRSEAEQARPSAARGASGWFKDLGSPGTSDLSAGASRANLTAASARDGATTVVLAPDAEVSNDTVERELAFFNPENETNTTHVVIASGLDERPQFVERRKNPVEVLRHAIEREPDRADLRLKLLELYYTAAAQNRRAFLEVTRQLAKNDKLVSAKEWAQIADMGRMIAPDDELFSGSMDNKAVG
jgi:pilus assembly protein FimV